MTSSPFTVQLSTQDQQTLTIDWEIFKQFGIFQPQNDPEERPREPVPIPNVSAATMNKVTEYCEQHRNDEPRSEDTPTKHTEWDKSFIASLDQEEVFDIIVAGNYLEIKPLLDLGCKHIAHMIKNKTPEEIRKMFNIQTDTSYTMPTTSATLPTTSAT